MPLAGGVGTAALLTSSLRVRAASAVLAFELADGILRQRPHDDAVTEINDDDTTRLPPGPRCCWDGDLSVA
jgi:hypothetical protein